MIRLYYSKIINLLYAGSISSVIYIELNKFFFNDSSIGVELLLFILYISLIVYIYNVVKET